MQHLTVIDFLRKPDNDFHLRVSHSSLSLWDNCRRKFMFRKLCNEPATGHSTHYDNLPAEVGICLHKAFQNYVLHEDKDKAIEALLFSYPMKTFIMSSRNNKNKWQIEAAYDLLTSLMSFHNIEQSNVVNIQCLDGVIRPAIEVPFELKFHRKWLDGRLSVSYVGFIDFIMFKQATEHHFVRDLKTTTWDINELDVKFKRDEQGIPYSFVLNFMLGAPLEEFKVSYLQAHLELGNTNVHDYIYDKTQYDVSEWYQGFVDRITEIENAVKTGIFRRNNNQCQSYRQTCEFEPFCMVRNIEQIENLLLVGQAPKLPDPIEPWVSFYLDEAA